MNLINSKKLKKANKKALNGMLFALPMIFGVLLLVSMITTLLPKSFYRALFSGNSFLDPFIGSLIGSVSAGNPITSYILGKGFLSKGVTLIAVTSFMVSWVTVGMVQLPAESLFLGKKFAIFRNLSAFFVSILVAIGTVLILKVL